MSLAGNSSAVEAALQGQDIGALLTSKGPVVKCVLLRHMRKNGRDEKPHAVASPSHGNIDEENGDNGKGDEKDLIPHHRHLHQWPQMKEMIEEIDVDTTPAKKQVQAILGGPFTFLGQYPDEGCVVMARKDIENDIEDIENASIKQLRHWCEELYDIDCSNMLEKYELIAALRQAQQPINPHRLQPPLDHLTIRGDILLMRVAETDEVLDREDEEEEETEICPDEANDKAEADTDSDKEQDREQPKIKVLSNDEFFLDYTAEEYIAFASRTDIVAPESAVQEEDEEGNDAEEERDEEEIDEDGDDDDDDEEDEDYEMDEEEDKRAILNLIMGELLRKFREENGRGPDTEELLLLRSQVADQLGVEVAVRGGENGDADNDNGGNRKRAASASPPMAEYHKRVKFDSSVVAAAEEYESEKEENDSKPKAIWQ